MNKWLVALTVMLPTLIEIVDTSIVNVSLDHIRGSLSAGMDEATWSITSYLVSNAIIIPMSGWLSRLFGRKRYLVSSIVLFTISSFLCGIAWNLQSLVFFRVLQGLGGGALQPLSQSILLETFPKSQHGTAMAVFGIGIMFGPIIGPLLGGWITDNWSWHWIFFVNIPIGIISIIMVLIFIVDPPYIKQSGLKIDYWGLIFLALGLGCLQVVLDKGQQENWLDSGFIATLVIVSAVSLSLFVIIELFAEHPIVNFRVFRNITFATGNIIMFFAFFNLLGSIVLLPIFLQSLMGYTSTLAGLVLGPGGLATLFAMPVVGKLITKINPKALLVFGILTAAYSTFLMSQFNLYADFDTLFLPRVILGIGMGFIFIPLTTITMSGIKMEDMGNATSVYNLLRNLGGSFSVALVTTVVARRAQFHQSRMVEHLTPFDSNYQIAADRTTEEVMINAGVPEPSAGYAGLAAIYKEMLRQVSMMSFNDAFWMLSALMVSILPLVLIMKRARGERAEASIH